VVEQVGALFDPAARLLAVELFQRELLADQNNRLWTQVSPFDALYRGPRAEIYRRRRQNNGLVLNYAGILLQGPALNWAGYAREFYDRACRKFVEAIELIPTYYQPYENLADTLTLRAKVEGLDSKTGRAMCSNPCATTSRQGRWWRSHYSKARSASMTPPVSSAGCASTRRSRPLLIPATPAALVREALLLSGQPAGCWDRAAERSVRILYNYLPAHAGGRAVR
jgi:hypothetical protein